ncbi:uncharacterized protein PWA37_003665 [Arxiozyma heterogenica]
MLFSSDLNLFFTIFVCLSCLYFSAHSIAMTRYKKSVPFEIN